MLIDWKGVAVLVVGIGALAFYAKKTVAGAVDSVNKPIGDAASKVFDYLEGPPIQLTPDAQKRQAEYIRDGYLEVLPDGRVVLTGKGEAFASKGEYSASGGTLLP